LGEWVFDWLLSCPAILVLGRFRLGDYSGYALLPLVYPRVNILGKGGDIRVLNTIPEYMGGSLFRKLCTNLVQGVIDTEDFLENALLKTMYYGGYNLVMDRNGEAIPVTIELVNTSEYRFYFKPGGKGLSETNTIDPWILLGIGLRTGYMDYVVEACRQFGAVFNHTCFIKTMYGVLAITDRESREPSPEYMRISPDNNPARHVINYDRVKEDTI